MSQFELDISFNLAIATRLDEEANVHVGYCPALNIYSQGRSSNEAEEAVTSAATLFIAACYERGILHGFLKEKGFTQISQKTGIAATEPKQYSEMSGFDRVVERSIPLQLLGSAGRMHDVPCSAGTY